MALLIFALVLVACGAEPAPPTPSATPLSTPADTTLPTATADVDTDPAATPTTGSGANGTTAAQGKLVLYTTRAESLIKPVIAAFNQAHPGIEVVLLTGSAGQLGAKLLEERANPQADLYVNTDTINMASLGQEGIFVPNSAPAVQAVPEQYRAADGSWVALTLRARVIMYNTTLVQPDEVPTSVFGLTDPKWKGQVGSADSTNGAMQAQIVAIRRLLGAERAESFIKGLVANDTQFFGGHTDVRKAVGTGELKLGLVNHYYYHLSKAEGAPVGVVYPDQSAGEMGLVVNSANAGIVQGGPNPAAARAMVDFLLSPTGQQIFAEQNYEVPIVPGVPLAAGVAPLTGYRLADITLKTMWDELEPTRQLMQSAGLP